MTRAEELKLLELFTDHYRLINRLKTTAMRVFCHPEATEDMVLHTRAKLLSAVEAYRELHRRYLKGTKPPYSRVREKIQALDL